MKQPIFYPGKQLNAIDLINLEEYAFSRTNIVIPDHGVVLLYNGNSPERMLIGKDTLFCVNEVTGITPAGRPVQFKAQGGRLKLMLKYDCTGNEVLFWDIYVDDRHPGSEETKNTEDEKYSLSQVPIGFENLDSTPPKIENDKLYIGRYKLTRDSHPEIISPPHIYSLASFNFPSQKWQEWTFPIREALRKLVAKTANDNLEFFIKHIIYNYPFWPLSQLFRACYQLAWLFEDKKALELLEEGEMEKLSDELRINPLPDSLMGIPPKDIPNVIAEILKNTGSNTWKQIPRGEYDLIDGALIIKRAFQGKHNIKFKFKTPQTEPVAIVADGAYWLQIEPHEEVEKNNQTTDNYEFPFPGSQEGNTTFSVVVPHYWIINEFSIWFRTIYDKP